MTNKFTQFISYFQQEFWNPPETRKPKNFFYKILRIFFSSIKGFIEDKCFDKASTLTFYSLMTLVPIIAIGFGIAQGLGFAEKFTEQVKTQFQHQPEIAEKIIEFSNSTLKTTKGGVVAGLGFVLLLWSVLKMIGNIEIFFNEIWKVETPRTLLQQVKSYVPMILLFPLFLVGSNSAIIFISTQAILATQSIDILYILSPFIKLLFWLIPYLISWGILSFFYIYLPNTKVYWKAGIIAGIAAGLCYALWQWIYITFQVHATSYGTIYGSFAAFPLFLLWLNYSWLIILFGTELSSHIQKIEKDKMISKF